MARISSILEIPSDILPTSQVHFRAPSVTTTVFLVATHTLVLAWLTPAIFPIIQVSQMQQTKLNLSITPCADYNFRDKTIRQNIVWKVRCRDSLQKQRQQLRNRYHLLIIYMECTRYKSGIGEKEYKTNQKQESSINSLWCSRWYLVTKCKWDHCNLQISSFPVRNPANREKTSLRSGSPAEFTTKYFYGKKYSSCNTCQTSPGSAIVK